MAAASGCGVLGARSSRAPVPGGAAAGGRFAMALLTCRSCGHYFVTTESGAWGAPATRAQLRCPPCEESRRFAPLAEFRRYFRGRLTPSALSMRDPRGRE